MSTTTKAKLSAAHLQLVEAMPPIPKALQVKNRKPLKPEQAARLAEVQKDSKVDGQDRKDWRKPVSMSWEDWDRHQAKEADERKAKSTARIEEMLEKKRIKAAGKEQAKAERSVLAERKRAEKAARPKSERATGYKGHIAGSRKERVHKLFDEKGADAAVKFATELGLKAGTPKSWIKTWEKETPAPKTETKAAAPKAETKAPTKSPAKSKAPKAEAPKKSAKAKTATPKKSAKGKAKSAK